MSRANTISSVDLRVIEDLLEMSGGYVLDFTNPQFSNLFRDCEIDIFSEQFAPEGTSKAKRFRSFLKQETDRKIGALLANLLQHYDYLLKEQGDSEVSAARAPFEALVRRLRPDLVGSQKRSGGADNEEALLLLEFNSKKVQLLPVDASCSRLLVERMEEAQRCIQAESYLSAVLLCGSVLEGICLGYGQKNTEKVNRGYACKFNKQPPDLWNFKLAEWIEVLQELGAFTPNVSKFGHALRDFRNYIHPNQQLASGFAIDKHTAQISFHIVIAAIDSILDEQKGTN